MPSCTDQQKRRTIETIEECGEFVIRARCAASGSDGPTIGIDPPAFSEDEK